MMYFLNDFKNKIDFFLRSHITFSRKNYNEKFENLSDIFHNYEQLIKILKEKYDFNLLQNSTRINFLINLYYLNIFDKYLSKQSKKEISILDIGSKNWEYAKSEYVFFHSFGENIELNGIELDANRMCTNFYTRYEIAKFYTKSLTNTNYISGDFMNHEQKYDYIIWILPFISEYPLIKWGLPLKYFKPKEMLSHAYNLLNEGGELLIINQGEKEALIQKELNNDLNLIAEYFGEIQDDFKLFKNKRYCCKIKK